MNLDELFTRRPTESDTPTPRSGRDVLPPVTWLAGAVLLIVVLGALIWCFAGTVTASVNITGIVFPHYGIEQIRSTRSGLVSYLQVDVGDDVEAGDLIAIVPQTDVYAQIEEARAAGASEQELAALYERYQSGSMIYTPVSGRVVDLVQTGQYIEAGELVAGVTSADVYSNEAEIRAYVPVSVAQRLSKGMEVRVTPQFTSGEQYNSIQGLVSSISAYPITQTDISEELGRFFTDEIVPQDGNIVEVRVTLLTGADDAALSWSRADGGSLNIDVSTLCALQVILDESTPWERLTSWMWGDPS